MTWKRLRKALVQTACLALVAASQIATAQDDALGKKVDLFLKDADLLQATQLLTRQTGIQFIIAPSPEPFEKINLSLSGKTAEEAIVYLCQAAGAWAHRDENGVYVIRKGAKPAENPIAPPEPVAQKPMVVKKIRLRSADARTVYEAIAKQIVFDPDRGFRELNTFMMGSRPSTINAANVTVVGQGPLGPSSYPVPASTPVLPSNSALPPSTESGSSIVLPGETANQIGGRGGGGMGGGIGGGLGGGQPGGGGLGGGIGGGGGLGGGIGGQGGTLQAGQGFVPEGIDQFAYDPTDNSLVVRGDDEAIRKLQALVSLFDVAPKQVIIKVEFITTSQSVAKSLGFDWLYQRGTINAGNRPGSFVRGGDPIFLNYASGNVTTRMRTLLLEGAGKVVNAPLLRTLNNQPALVQQGQSTTIFINQVINAAGGVTTVPQPVQYQVQSYLIVRPRINDDGYITMTLTPQISDFGQVRRGPDGQEIPDQLYQSINVVARVKSGSTIALAGMTRKSLTSSVSRFPILSDLPIIGQFFRSTSQDRADSELIVFVTPYIVEDDDQGGLSP